jgi:hypothetical protein
MLKISKRVGRTIFRLFFRLEFMEHFFLVTKRNITVFSDGFIVLRLTLQNIKTSKMRTLLALSILLVQLICQFYKN